MEKPYKFRIICDKTGKVSKTNLEPTIQDTHTYESIGCGRKALVQTKTVYIDTRYEARLRLYKWLTHGRFLIKK